MGVVEEDVTIDVECGFYDTYTAEWGRYVEEGVAIGVVPGFCDAYTKGWASQEDN